MHISSSLIVHYPETLPVVVLRNHEMILASLSALYLQCLVQFDFAKFKNSESETASKAAKAQGYKPTRDFFALRQPRITRSPPDR